MLKFPFMKFGPALLLAFLVTVAEFSWIVPAHMAHAVERLMSRDEARSLGLERAWFAQVRLDRARSQVQRAILVGDRLTVLTSVGLVHEFNAVTGETIWTAPVGNENFPSLGPAADDKYVAVVNGSTLFVLRREDGRPVLDRRVGGGPGAAPAVAAEYVFVPLINGRMEGYPLNQGTDKTHTPWYYQSYGRAMVAPLATPMCIIWSTEKGHLYVGRSLNPAVRFRLETRSDIVAPPAYRDPLVYVGSTAGDLFGLHEMKGTREWKFATGYPIIRAPAAVGDRVYVTTEEPAMHCVDAKTGQGIWETPAITQFAAASSKRVYGIDDLRALVVVDANTGALLDRMPTDGSANALVNDHTDRLYLISEDGLLQCLHEIGVKEPLYHNPPPPKSAEPDAATAEVTPLTETREEVAPPEGAGVDANAGEGAVEPSDQLPAKQDLDVEEDPFGDIDGG
jgi:outer membrane protein assembly factor BamB